MIPFVTSRHPHLFAVVLAVTIVVGCRVKTDDHGSISEDTDLAPPARRDVERGPVRLRVEVDPQPVRLSDEPTLTLTIDFEQGVEIQRPPFGEALGDFLIRDFREPLPEIKKGREIVRQIYTLEPTRTGSLVIAAISMSFTDRRPKGDGKQHTIETEALTVEVASMVNTEVPSLEDLQPAVGPVTLPDPAFARTGWIVTAIFVVATGGLVWYLRRRKQRVVTQELSPRELAYLDLQQLIQDRLDESDIKLFYVRLTGIVRRYIERTSGIHAPEQTTEEFLREIGSGEVFSIHERDRLQSFLEAADLVKYAAYHPFKSDIETTFQRAKAFIGLSTQAQEAAA